MANGAGTMGRTTPASVVARRAISALRAEPGEEIGPDRPAVGRAVAQGMPARVRLAATPSVELSATVGRIADAAGAKTAEVAVSWTAPLPPVGSEAQATILLDRRDGALRAPVGAIRRDEGRSLADVVDGGTIHTVDVTTGLIDGDKVEILSGLQEGQLVRIGS